MCMAYTPQEVQAWYEWYMAEPHRTLEETARYFGVSTRSVAGRFAKANLPRKSRSDHRNSKEVSMSQFTPQPGTLAQAREDLAGFILYEQAMGDNERDPYGFAVTTIRVALEFALDDGISGSMSAAEYATLSALAQAITNYDPASAPRGFTPEEV